MSCGVSIQYARLLSDILDDVKHMSSLRSDNEDDDYDDESSLLSRKAFSTTSKLLTNDADDLPPPFGTFQSTSYDPDTESDEHEFCDTSSSSSPSSPTSNGNSDDEGNDLQLGRRSDDVLLCKGAVDERTCARLLQSKINAVLDQVALDTDSTPAVLERFATLPADLKSELFWRSISRKSMTDAMLHCFLTTRGASPEDKECPSELALQLRRLSLFECQKVTDAGLRTIARCCPSLQSLDLTRCRGFSALGLQSVIRSCTALSDLFVSGCPALCDKTISTVFRYNNPPHIRCLSIRRCDIHDYGLSTLASYCPTLQKLDVRCCGLLTAAGYYALVQRVPSIDVLSCGRCIGTDDLALRYIGQGFGASLTELNLAMCWRVSSRGVAEIARHCKQLRSLNLSSCTLVDDSALHAICQSPDLQQSLVCLNLNECNVGDDALEELVANCSSLSCISVVGCPRVTYARAVRLAQLAGIQIIM